MHSKVIGKTNFLYHQNHFDNRPDLRAFLESPRAQEVAQKYPGINVVLGGDGTLLRAVREYAHENKALLGINFGSKGNLLVKPEELESELTLLSFPLIEAYLESGDTHMRFNAFNEVVCKSTSGRSIRVHYESTDGSQGLVAGDGLLLCTPCGSTGYNLAAGGPRLEHESRSFALTALIPFDPIDFTSIVYDDDTTITLGVTNDRGRPTSVYADGDAIIEHTSDPVHIVMKKSKHMIQLYKHLG